jgi:predicted nucleic acid-binding protein
MILILDVSASIEIILKKEKKALFESHYQSAKWVIAPDLFVPEISNVLWKYYKAKVLTHEECNQYVDDGIKMVDDFIDAKELWKEALGESIKNNHSVYDMFYAVLARRNDGKLITKDDSLAKICRKLKIDVVN